MPLQPIPFQNFAGGIADRYIGTDNTRCQIIDNMYIDETQKLYCRDGTSIFKTRFGFATGQTKPTGLYIGPDPFSHPFVVIGRHGYTINELGSFTEATGPSGGAYLPTKTDTTYEHTCNWRRQLIAATGMTGVQPQMVYCSSFTNPATYKVLTPGMPKLASSPSVTNTGTTNSYLYAFFYKYTFTDYTSVTFAYFGNPVQISIQTVSTPDAVNIPVTGIPVLANTAVTNYDTANVTVEIYRTANGGADFFFLASINNGTTTYTDSTADLTLQSRAPIYNAQNAPGWDVPPSGALYVTQTNDNFWYATSGTLYQSIAGNPGAVPASFRSDIDQKISGLSDYLSFPILFCDQSVYRVEGVFDSLGNGGFILREISKTAGCLSNRSIVKIPGGLVWFGNGGIWFTNGFSCTKLSMHLNTSYGTWVNSQVVGCYDAVKNFVYWTVNSIANSVTTANDTILVLDLNKGLKEESVFVTASSVNNLLPSTFAFTSSTDVKNAGSVYSPLYNRLLFTDARGYLLWFDPLSYTDPRIDTLVYPSQMAKRVIQFTIITAGLDQGTVGFRKYTPEVSVEFDAKTSLAIQVRHRRDDGGIWSGTGGYPAYGRPGSPGGGSNGNPGVPEFRLDDAILWNITDCVWQNDSVDYKWNDTKILDGRRSVPAGLLRSGRRQLWFTNSYTLISKSDLLTTATVAKGVRQLTIDSASLVWPTDCEDYFMTFASDGYVQSFQIKYRLSSSVIEVYDPYSLLVNGSQKWEMFGFRKFERPRLISYTLHAEVDGPTMTPSSGTGGNV